MYFKLAREPQDISIAILDQDGKMIRNYTREQMALNFGLDAHLNSGLNKFVWDMRINALTPVPKRPPTAVMPIVPPGKYKAQLTVDGVVETQEFEILLSPKESYTREQAEAKFTFWMEMYNSAENWTQNVIAALKVKEDVNAKLEAFVAGGTGSSKVKEAEEQAEVIAAMVNAYEGTFVSTGRTLAEVINLPATILFKMSFMSGILDHSEGPVSQSMKAVYAQLVEDAKAADEQFNKSIEAELARFEKLVK